ncbi:MAG: hypothetical protein MUE99_11570, partial [Chitinophagaceae bacterium]|nr:hypothetical protein [Chitinophagaceae bacterium]
MAILKTRLYKPSVKKKFVIRDRLFAKLNEELDRPLKLIVAGAGYGKSVLMSQWLDTYDKKYCWISLEEDCNELHIFLSYFIAGIQQQFPEGMQHTAKLNSSNIMPSGEVIGQLLNNDLQALPESLFIVLDDFHVIRNKIITAIFNQIISFPPENVQIALISRLDPPLNKTKLQAYQKICEIRMSDLRFSVNEIVKVAKQSFEIEMDEGVASHIEEGTEGWALSVYLKIREFVFKDPATAEKSTEYDHAGTLTPFLFNLIEAALPPGTERLLLVTALFDRFDLELIKRVLGENGDTSVMHEDLGFALQKLNKLGSPLLIGLDDEKKWFRLHHFIREILYKRLVQINSTDQIEKYYRVAGLYFADQGCYEEGIKYAKLGNDLETAVNIIESGCDRLMDKGENLRLQRWLDMIPVTTLSTNPLLQVISAYLCDTIYYDYGAMRNYMDQAAKYLDDKNSYRRLLGAYAAVHACLSAQEKNLPDALQWADRALDTLLPEQKFLRDYVLNYKVLATSMVRSAAEAQALINNLEIISKPPDNRRLLRIKVIKLMFDWTQANHRNLKLSGKIVVDIGKQEGVWWLYKMGCYYM